MSINTYYMDYKEDIKRALDGLSNNYYYMKVAESVRRVLEKNNVVGRQQMKFSRDDLKNILKIFGGNVLFTENKNTYSSYLEKVSDEEFNVYINTLSVYETSIAFVALGTAIFKLNEIEKGALLRIEPKDIHSKIYSDGFGLGIDTFVNALLMPEDIFVNSLNEHMQPNGEYVAEPVAEDFGVPLIKVLCRYDNLYGRQG